MATYVSPSPHIYDPQDSSSQDYYEPFPDTYPCQLAHGSHYYPHPEEQATGYLVGAHGVTAVPANDQALISHHLYGDASSAVIPYTTAHEVQSSERWAQPNHSQLQTRFHSDTQQPRAFYEPGEVSPASDDSAGTYYDSPQPYAHAHLFDDRRYYENVYGQTYYEQIPSASAISTKQLTYGPRSSSGFNVSYDYGQVSPVSFNDREGYDMRNYAHGHCGEYVQEGDHQITSQDFSLNAAPGDYRQRSPARYGAEPPQLVAPMQPPVRSESPMGHLPYQDSNGYSKLTEQPARRYHSAPTSTFELSDTPRQSSLERPQPLYPNAYNSHQSPYPPPIAIPAPRSPPLVEDTPKKPLTLACFFCRKRKIACGSPPPGKTDRTCNQCARRNLECVYPVNSRRGTRQRELDGFSC